MGSRPVSVDDVESDDSLPEPLRSPQALHDPFGWYDRKRSSGPVHYDSQRGVYDVFSYEHVKTGLQDNERFPRPRLSERSGEPLSYFDTAMVWSDGPDHKQAKGELFEYFSPRMLEGVQESVRDIAESQLRVALEDGPQFDFVEAFAVPVPLRVIMDVVGIPQDDHQRVLDWLKTFRRVMTSEHSAVGSKDDGRMAEAQSYFKDLVTERDRDPRTDLISQLAANTDLSPEEIGSNCFDFVLAGQGTMSEFLANALYLFDETGLTGSLGECDLEVVLEEVLRYRAPLQSRARETTEPVTLGGTEIPAGETVILWIGAANRDPERYDRPEQFRPERDPEHLAFGSGAHNCIGAPLARLQAPIVIETFFDRIDGVDLDLESARPKPKASKLGFERLPVRVDLV